MGATTDATPAEEAGKRRGRTEPRPEKVAAVEEIKEQLRSAQAVLLTEYRGLGVTDMADLRSALRDAGAEYRVIKNTLATIAARDAGLDTLIPLFEGPTAVVYVSDEGDAAAAARQITEFAKRAPTLLIKGGLLEGEMLEAERAVALSKVEPREVLLAKTAGMFLSPIQQTANLLAAGFNQMGSLLAQRREQLEKEAA